MGPAFCSSFSTGVRSGCGSSFLLLADAVLSDFEAPWKCHCQSRTGVPRCREHGEGATGAGWGSVVSWCLVLCAGVCGRVYVRMCAEARCRVLLTEPVPLSLLKNPAMASAAETRRPGRYSTGRDGHRGGGLSRRCSRRCRRSGGGGGGSFGKINATEGWGGGGGWRWRQRRQFGGNHPAGRGREWPAVIRDTRRDGRGWRRLGLGGRARSCGGTIQVAQSLEVSARRGSRRAGEGEAWAGVDRRGQAWVGLTVEGGLPADVGRWGGFSQGPGCLSQLGSRTQQSHGGARGRPMLGRAVRSCRRGEARQQDGSKHSGAGHAGNRHERGQGQADAEQKQDRTGQDRTGQDRTEQNQSSRTGTSADSCTQYPGGTGDMQVGLEVREGSRALNHSGQHSASPSLRLAPLHRCPPTHTHMDGRQVPPGRNNPIGKPARFQKQFLAGCGAQTRQGAAGSSREQGPHRISR